MRADLVPVDELTERDVQAWRELAARSLEPNPSFEPEFVLPLARLLDPGGVQLLRVRDGEESTACLPVRKQRGWRRIPLPALVAWRHAYSLLGTPLVDAGRAPEAVEAMLDLLRVERRSTFVALELVTADGPTAKLIDEAQAEDGVRPRHELRFERAVLHRRPENDYLAVGAKHRREWQRQRRKLQELLDEEVVAADRSGDPSAVEDFLELEAGGWKGRAGTAFASLPGHSDAFTEICDGFRKLGRLQLLTLEAGSRRLAVKCNLIAGKEIFCFKIAFDDTLSKYSPGIQLELENMRVFHEQTKAELIDSCAWSHNEMINRLWPDRRALDTVVFSSAPLRGRIGLGAVRMGSWLRSKRNG